MALDPKLLENLPEILGRVRAEQAKRSFKEFVHQAWHIVEPGTPLIWGWVMDALCDHLQAVAEGKIRRIVICVPPGTSKSRLTRVFWPAYIWTRMPHSAFISASYALDLTIRDNLAVRRLVESEWYKTTFGIEIAEDDGGKVGFSLNTSGSLKALTVGTGKTTGFRGDFFTIDDPLNVMDANSPVKRAEANEWFRSSAQSRLNNVSKSAIVLIMQRVAEDDVADVAIRMGYEKLIIPMVWDESYRATTSIGWTDPRTKEGELMFPERFPEEYVRTLPDPELGIGPYAYAAQYQQIPVPRTGALFLVDNIPLIEHLPEDDYITVRAWDLAGTEGAGAYTVGVRMRYGKNTRKFYIDDVQRAQLSSGKVRDLILSTAEDDGTDTRIVIPRDPGQAGVAQVDDLVALLAGYTVKSEIQSGKKEVRADPLASQVERGHLKVVKTTWTTALIEEMRFFPKGRFMDQVDAASSAFNHLAALTRQRRRVLQLIVDSERQTNYATGVAANG